jgi:diguanylate cyclase (GGDEF)-like protein/putative nucleotidyltransferase with HDIG domain
LVVSYNRTLDVGFIGVIVPLLLVLYFTFRSTIARIDDADRHVEELNALYLSTIETLAMAIDAKDQVTHGHIRRVQAYAVGLARFVGVSDTKQLKAIEAAALLHDMGKLAVPEYILNKPGTLTPAEFEKMKLHASVGADILSEIAFPYPVVPIVRYHHEAWNGTGYPEGLRGTDIPIGARILAVVDCFDALTSDRPYRPRLSDEEALNILLDRRGSMYDPLIVDTFVKVHDRINPEPVVTVGQEHAIEGIRKGFQESASPPRLEQITASSDEMLTLYALAQALAGHSDVVEAGDIVAKHLRRLIPSSLCVFFLYDSKADDMEAALAYGEGNSLIRGLRIPLGQRLSGWVGAHRQTIANSDPSLDLGDIARAISPRLRSCLCTPLTADDQLIGTLTLYSALPDSFNDDHKRIIETVARHVASKFVRSRVSGNAISRDPITELPYAKQLDYSSERPRPGTAETASFALIVDVVNLERINAHYGRDVGDDALRHAVAQAKSALPPTARIFRLESDEFIVLLEETNAEAVEAIALTIKTILGRHPMNREGGATLGIDVTLLSVPVPGDACSLTDLIATYRSRLQPQAPSSIRVH